MNTLPILIAKDLFEGPESHLRFAEQFHGPFDGRAVVAFPDGDHQRNHHRALGLLSSLGTVLSVYPDLGPWSDLEVRTEADPGRTHGVGENRLHIDMVDRERTPRIIALYCIRDDPRGGEADLILAKHRNGPTKTITVADPPATAGGSWPSQGGQGHDHDHSFALLSQHLAGGFQGSADAGQIATAASNAASWLNESILTRPQH